MDFRDRILFLYSSQINLESWKFCVLLSEYVRDQKRSKDAGRGIGSSTNRPRSRSPHQIREIPAAGRREAEWSSRDVNPVPREIPVVHVEREAHRHQRDRREATLPTRHDTATVSHNVRLRRDSHSDSSPGLFVCLSVWLFLSVCLCVDSTPSLGVYNFYRAMHFSAYARSWDRMSSVRPSVRL